MDVVRKRIGWAWLGLAVVAAGCENFAPPHQSWTEAQVNGRVIDAQSGTPIAGATVSRVKGKELGDSYEVEKGAKQMQRQPTVASTDREGRFVLAGEKTAYLFLESFPSYTVTLRIQARGFDTLQRYFTNVVMGTNGMPPTVDTGDIKMLRR
jgi:hypothetical protein